MNLPFPPWCKVVSKLKTGLRWRMTLECGHTADAVNPDPEVPCMACGDKTIKQHEQNR